MRKPITLVNWTLALSALALAGWAAGDNRVYAIRDAKVHTLGSSGTLSRATVVVVDGKIAGVGAGVKIPAGAQIINGQGLEVYPGMINAWSNLGLTEITSVPATNDASEMGDYNPHLLAFTAIHPASEHIPVARVNGITASVSAPSGGIIAGQATLLHLDGWTVDEMALLKSAGLVLDFPSLDPAQRLAPAAGAGAARSDEASLKSSAITKSESRNCPICSRRPATTTKLAEPIPARKETGSSKPWFR